METQNLTSEIAFSQPVLNIGADSGNDIILRGEGVADFHVMLIYDSDQWSLIPMDPSYPTLVNSIGVGQAGTVIKTGTVISIGGYRLTVSLAGINTDIMIQQPVSPSSAPSDFSGDNSEKNIILTLNPPAPTEVAAGNTAEFELTVTNSGPLVANMQLQVQGITSSWVKIIPPVLNLNEGNKGVFTVRINPPRDSSAHAGNYHIHFVAISPNYPGETGTADAGLNILPYSQFLVNGPTPRRVNISRNHSTGNADIVILNHSNADSTFWIRAIDDSNELLFSSGNEGGSISQGQESVTVRAGDNNRIPYTVTSKKLPLVGFAASSHHYYINVVPSDNPAENQSVVGEVHVKPMINFIWVILLLIILGVAALFIFQPYIYSFSGSAGKRTEVLLAGNSTWMSWHVSPFATDITLDDGSGPRTVSRKGNEYVAPSVSTTYTIRSENFISKLLGTSRTRVLQVMVIPTKPTIALFQTNLRSANFNQPVTLSWAVGANASTAEIVTNRQTKDLTPENYSGTLQAGYMTDTLFSLQVGNQSAYDMLSLFLNVNPENITLTRFVAWVKPTGIAVPSNNDTTKNTMWGALQPVTFPTASPTGVSSSLRPATIMLQPAAQSNVLEIPDDFSSGTGSSGIQNPEQLSGSGQNAVPVVTYTEPDSGTGSGPDLLVRPQSNPLTTATPVPYVSPSSQTPLVGSGVPGSSPETLANREYSVKLVEIVEDPYSENGYRVLRYFPNYVLQKGEAVLIEWAVTGVNQIKIEGLSTDNLPASGSQMVYPQQSTTYVLSGEVGNVKKNYSLPVEVEGGADDAGSGKNCELKVNAATLTVPGTVMLTWTGAGNNRVQLLSSAKAEQENADAEKKKEEEAKASGQPYTPPTNPPLTGGIIGDYLQPSGFMRVSVNKQTSFVLNAFDSSGNIICSKTVEVKYTGGNDKLDLKLAIIRVTDINDIEQKEFALGQTVQVTVRLSGFDKGKEPTGTIMVTDGYSTCQMTYPVTTCSFVAKHLGTNKLTAVYSGDDTYNKKTATGSMRVINKIDTEITIDSAFKKGTTLADIVSTLTWDPSTAYGHVPTGTITFTAGSGTCDLDITTFKLTCDGTAIYDAGSYKISDLLLADPSAKTVRAVYNGDDYFNKSVSKTYSFSTLPTTLNLSNALKPNVSHVNVEALLGWDTTLANGQTPTGTITFTVGSGTCILNITTKKLDCDGNVTTDPSNDFLFILTDMLVKDVTGASIKASYSGDGFFLPSESETLSFDKVNTTLSIDPAAYRTGSLLANVIASLTWDKDEAGGALPTGTVTFTIGTDTCKLNVEDPKDFSCKGESTSVSLDDSAAGTYKWTLEKILLSAGNNGDRVSASYSGDSLFNPATAHAVLFKTSETTTSISGALKSHSGLVNMTVSVTGAVPHPEGNSPSGTITFTSGKKTCKLDISGSAPKFLDCDADSVTVDSDGKYVIVGLAMGSDVGKNIKADYSGDGFFLPSVSPTIDFGKIDTELSIDEAYKHDTLLANIIATLLWDKDKANGSKPTGTITFTTTYNTSVLGKCVLTLGTNKMNCEGTVGLNDSTDGKNEYTIEDMLLDYKDADRIKAEYSGDDIFNPSESTTVLFQTVPTELAVPDLIKDPSTGQAEGTVRLTWDDTPPAGIKPVGTVKLTAGNAVCTIDFTSDPAKFADCEGDVTLTKNAKEFVFAFENLKIGDGSAVSIKAEYSGDGMFLKSESDTAFFETVPTTLEARSARHTGDGLSRVVVYLSWDDVPVEDMTPTGTIKLTAGSSTCTFIMDEYKSHFTDCEGKISFNLWRNSATDPWYFQFNVHHLKIGDGSETEIKAEYSGDYVFEKSESEKTYFGKADTELSIIEAYKPDDSTLNMTSTLSWCSAGCETDTYSEKPTGVITYTIGSDTCKLDLSNNSFTCSDKDTVITVTDSSEYTYDGSGNPVTTQMTRKIVFEKILLSAGNTADRVTAVFEGDKLFNPSSSLITKLKTIATKTVIRKQEKTPGGLISGEVDLSWEEEAPGGLVPRGTVKLTSGTAVCTLDLSANPVKFTDCSGNVSVSGSGQKKVLVISGLDMGSGSGNDIKAEYSGSGMFEKSASEKVSFGLVDTETAIVYAWKPGEPKHANLQITLSWDKEKAAGQKPSGDLKLVIGSGTCTLNLSKDKLSCDSDSVTKVDNGGSYTITIENILLDDISADRVSAEYAGDSVFNPSSSVKTLFEKVDTETIISWAVKTDDGYLNLNVFVDWDNTKDHGFLPTGTLKITAGGNVITCDLATGKLSHDGTVDISTDRRNIIFKKVLLDDTSADRIRVEYAGDALFNSSSAPETLFSLVETTITVEKAYMDSKGTVFIQFSLDWSDEKANGELPDGKITIEVDGKSVAYDITEGTLDPVGGTVTADEGRRNYRITGLAFDPLHQGSTGTVSVSYEGNEHFSGSKDEKPFGKIKTETTIYVGAIVFPSYLQMYLKLLPNESIDGLAKPSGSLSLTVTGGVTINSCKLDIAAEGVAGEKACNGHMVRWGLHSGSIFEIAVYTSASSASATVSYSGDSLYEESTSSTYALSTTRSYSKVKITEAIKMKRGAANYRFTLLPEDGGDERLTGTVTLYSGGARVCAVTYEAGSITNDCGANVTYNSTDKWYTVTNVPIPDTSATSVYAIYSGDLSFWGTESESAAYTSTPVTLSLPSSSEYNSRFYEDMRLIGFINEEYTMNSFRVYPSGILRFTFGDTVCDAQLTESYHEGSVSPAFINCSGSLLALTTASNPETHATLSQFEILDLVLANTNFESYTVQYIDGYAYEDSNVLTVPIAKNTTTVTAELSDDGSTLSTQVKGSAGSAPGGTVTYTFNNSGKSCTVNFSYSYFTTTCDGTVRDFIKDAGNSLTRWNIQFNSFDPADTDVTVSYGGDQRYLGSETTVRIAKYNLTITPDTSNIYSDGRLYFNTNSGSLLYPLYPERHSDPFAYCNGGVSRTDCHVLKREFQLLVRIELDTASIELPSDTVITFTGTDATCIPYKVSDGVYECLSGLTFFSTTGEKKVTATYAGSVLFNSASADFPEMYAVSLSSSAAATNTVILFPEDGASFEVGDTVTVLADVTSSGVSISGQKLFNFYTYDRTNNVRIASCYGESGTCTLEITGETNYIAAEFIGTDSYLPSSAQAEVVLPSVSVEPMSASPVSISVELEP